MINQFLNKKSRKRFFYSIFICCFGLVFQFLFVNTSQLNIIQVLESGALPAGVPETTAKNSLCILPEESAQLKDYIWSNENTFKPSSCSERFIKPVTVLKGQLARYAPNSGGSIYLCAGYRQQKGSATPLTEALTHIQKFADTNLNSQDPVKKEQASRCLAQVYYNWAKADGMGKIQTTGHPQPEYIQMWNTGGFATLYLKYPTILEQASKLGPSTSPHSEVIKNWFVRLGIRVRKQIEKIDKKVDGYTYTVSSHHYGRDNMAFWRGYSLMSTAIISGNIEHLNKSHEIFKTAVNEITNGGPTADARDKGFLPGELKRRARALTYHAFALEPLAGMINLSKAIDCDFLRTDQVVWNIALLTRKIIEGHRKQEVFEEAAFCYINNDCNKTSNLTVTREQVKQSVFATSEHLIPLYGNDYNSNLLIKRVDNYLRSLGIKRVDKFVNPNAYISRSLGGNILYSPTKSSLNFQNKDTLKFCLANGQF